MTDLFREAVDPNQSNGSDKEDQMRVPETGDLVFASGRGLCLIERVLVDPAAVPESPLRIAIYVRPLGKRKPQGEPCRLNEIWGWWPTQDTSGWVDAINQLDVEMFSYKAEAHA